MRVPLDSFLGCPERSRTPIASPLCPRRGIKKINFLLGNPNSIETYPSMTWQDKEYIVEVEAWNMRGHHVWFGWLAGRYWPAHTLLYFLPTIWFINLHQDKASGEGRPMEIQFHKGDDTLLSDFQFFSPLHWAEERRTDLWRRSRRGSAEESKCYGFSINVVAVSSNVE